MKTGKMYSLLAKYYDLTYRWKNYGKEAYRIHDLIQKHKRTTGGDLLDVACGTGSHIQHLKLHYKVTGVDISKEMLDIARRRNPDVAFYEADMVAFNLGKKFDAVISLFSSIGHVKTYRNLNRAMACFSAHLKPGGVLIVEPFLSKDTYLQGTVHGSYVDEPDVKIARVNLSERRGELAVLDFHYLIGTKDGVTHLRDKQEVALFETPRVLEIMRANGFRAKFLKRGLMKGRGLYIGVKE